MQWKIQLAHIKEARKVTIQILFRSKYKKSKENIENFDKQIRIERNRSGRMRGSKRVREREQEQKRKKMNKMGDKRVHRLNNN